MTAAPQWKANPSTARIVRTLWDCSQGAQSAMTFSGGIALCQVMSCSLMGTLNNRVSTKAAAIHTVPGDRKGKCRCGVPAPQQNEDHQAPENTEDHEDRHERDEQDMNALLELNEAAGREQWAYGGHPHTVTQKNPCEQSRREQDEQAADGKGGVIVHPLTMNGLTIPPRRILRVPARTPM